MKQSTGIKIAFAVTSDLITDQRVDRIASVLHENGAAITVIGRVLSKNLLLNPRLYKTRRFHMFFIKGPLFYIFYNLRLFLHLLFKKYDRIISNDLDTLLACFLISRLKKLPLVFDSHELFTELPELQNRKVIKKIWTFLERMILPHIKHAYTVCDSLAMIYKERYGTDFLTIRNLPLKKGERNLPEQFNELEDKNVIIYQGYINKGRGIEKVIRALNFMHDVIFVVIGRGDIENELKMMVKEMNLEEKVIFTGVIPYIDLHNYTCMGSIGISLEENLGLNYYYSLPNKIFDYIQAGVPVLASDFPETQKIINKYNIGIATLEDDPQKLASLLENMIHDKNQRQEWEINLEKAANELTWENESQKLIKFYKEMNFI